MRGYRLFWCTTIKDKTDENGKASTLWTLKTNQMCERYSYPYTTTHAKSCIASRGCTTNNHYTSDYNPTIFSPNSTMAYPDLRSFFLLCLVLMHKLLCWVCGFIFLFWDCYIIKATYFLPSVLLNLIIIIQAIPSYIFASATYMCQYTGIKYYINHFYNVNYFGLSYGPQMSSDF